MKKNEKREKKEKTWFKTHLFYVVKLIFMNHVVFSIIIDIILVVIVIHCRNSVLIDSDDD